MIYELTEDELIEAASEYLNERVGLSEGDKFRIRIKPDNLPGAVVEGQYTVTDAAVREGEPERI